MKLKKLPSLTLVAFILMTIILPIFTLAQDIGQGNLDTVAQKSFFNTAVGSDSFLNTVAGEAITVILGFIGAIFMLLIIYSGVQWMTAGGNEEKVAKAQNRLKFSSIGLAIIFFSYILTTFIFYLLFQYK
jgi:hypothetical protein